MSKEQIAEAFYDFGYTLGAAIEAMNESINRLAPTIRELCKYLTKAEDTNNYRKMHGKTMRRRSRIERKRKR